MYNSEVYEDWKNHYTVLDLTSKTRNDFSYLINQYCVYLDYAGRIILQTNFVDLSCYCVEIKPVVFYLFDYQVANLSGLPVIDDQSCEYTGYMNLGSGYDTLQTHWPIKAVYSFVNEMLCFNMGCYGPVVVFKSAAGSVYDTILHLDEVRKSSHTNDPRKTWGFEAFLSGQNS